MFYVVIRRRGPGWERSQPLGTGAVCAAGDFVVPRW